jgi:hypothetical protein
MANFKDWALQYVIADDDATMRDVAAKSAKGLLMQFPLCLSKC